MSRCNCAQYGGDCNACRGDGKSGLPALDAERFRPGGSAILSAIYGLVFFYLLILLLLV